MTKKEIIEKIIDKATGGSATELAWTMTEEAFDMGVQYDEKGDFNHSAKQYHNYQYDIGDGETVSFRVFFDVFTARLQTHAYLDAGNWIEEIMGDPDKVAFKLVRRERFGIDNVYKAIVSPREMKLEYGDFVMVIAGFCAGVLWSKAQKQ